VRDAILELSIGYNNNSQGSYAMTIGGKQKVVGQLLQTI